MHIEVDVLGFSGEDEVGGTARLFIFVAVIVVAVRVIRVHQVTGEEWRTRIERGRHTETGRLW